MQFVSGFFMLNHLGYGTRTSIKPEIKLPVKLLLENRDPASINKGYFLLNKRDKKPTIRSIAAVNTVHIFQLFTTLVLPKYATHTMRRKSLIVFGVVLLLFLGGYIFLGDYVGDQFYPDGSVNSSKSQEIRFPKDKKILNPFELNDIDGDFTFTSEDNFNFKLSDYEILRPISKDIITGIAEMQLYFGANDARRVRVSGWYTSSEKNTSSFPNLGLARANSVKEYLIIQGIPSSRIDLRGVEKNDLKHYKEILYGPVAFQISLGASISEENKK